MRSPSSDCAPPPGRGPRALDLRLAQRRHQRPDDALGDAILELEHVLDRAVEVVGPEMTARRDIDQLAGDAHPGPCLADAALEHVAHAELAPDLLDVDRA